MLITQSIDELLGGVSQALQRLRDTSQAEEQVNLLSHLSKGLRKRPPSQYVAKLTSDTTGYDTAFDHTFNRSDTGKFRVVIVNGDLKVYNTITGAEVSVIFPNGKAYLSGTLGSDFRAVTIGDSIVIVNRTFVGAKNVSKKAANAVQEAMIAVKQGDFSVSYTIILDGYTVSYKTPDSASANAKAAIATDQIAAALANAVATHPILSGLFTVTIFSSALHFVHVDGSRFTLDVTDGLAGKGLLAIKGQVQTFEQLPAVAKTGMIVEVVGSPESQADNYFVQYDDSDTPGQAGVWREVVKPGALTDLDGVTLPHVLAFGGDILQQEAAFDAPVFPAISSGGASQSWTQGWQLKDALAISETSDYTVYQHNESFTTTLTALDGTGRTITVTYDVNASSLDPTDTVKVDVQLETGTGTGVYVSQQFGIYNGGASFANQTISFSASPAVNVRLKVVYTYGSAATPGLPDVAYLTMHGKNNVGGPGILLQKGLGSTLTFGPTVVYPAGYALTVALDGNNFLYTVGAADQTGAQMATGIAALIDPNVTYAATNPSSGVVLLTQGSGVPPVTSVSTSWNITTTFWSHDLAMTPGEHVGRTIKNLTDSSTGVVIANTGTTIAVVSLTGGADDKFEAGDLCSLVGAGDYFVFSTATWESRVAGDDVSNPFPPFVDQTIDDVFFYEDRLGFTVGENVVCSASSEHFFNFFRTTVTDLLASDTIAVKPPARRVKRFDSAVPWVDGVYLFTEAGEFFRVSGNPLLTPSTVRIDVMGKYPVSRNVRPLVAGTRLLLTSERNGSTRLAFAERLLSVAGVASVTVNDITKHVPTYLLGNPTVIAVDDEAQVILVLTDGAPRSIYTCFYAFASDETFAQLAWSRWDFAINSNVVALDVLNGDVGMIFKRLDGVYLESLTMDPEETITQQYLIGDGTALGDGSWGGDGLQV